MIQNHSGLREKLKHKKEWEGIGFPMLFLFSERGAGVDQRTKLLCENVFELSAMAEELQIIGSITVEDSRELFYLVLDWAEEFEKQFDPETQDWHDDAPKVHHGSRRQYCTALLL